MTNNDDVIILHNEDKSYSEFRTLDFFEILSAPQYESTGLAIILYVALTFVTTPLNRFGTSIIPLEGTLKQIALLNTAFALVMAVLAFFLVFYCVITSYKLKYKIPVASSLEISKTGKTIRIKAHLERGLKDTPVLTMHKIGKLLKVYLYGYYTKQTDFSYKGIPISTFIKENEIKRIYFKVPQALILLNVEDSDCLRSLIRNASNNKENSYPNVFLYSVGAATL